MKDSVALRVPDEIRKRIDALVTSAGYNPRVRGAQGILPLALDSLLIVSESHTSEFTRALKSARMNVGVISISDPDEVPASPTAEYVDKWNKAQPAPASPARSQRRKAKAK